MRRLLWIAAICVLAMGLTAFGGGNGTTLDPDDVEAPADEDAGTTGARIIDDRLSLDDAPATEFGVEPAPLAVREVEFMSELTGADSPVRADERWNIEGSDLGFSFEYDGIVYMVFGDTWGRDGVEGNDWRSNIMVMVEPDPEHGYVITDVIADEHGDAKEILSSLKIPKEEYTVIPNTGIAVGDRMYLHYISVKDWKRHWWNYKEPIPNGSGFAYSDDGGHTWIKDDVARWEGDSPFAQAAMVEHDGYIYVFGTPAGRFGPAQLLRVEPDDLLDPAQYEYWAGDDWSPDPAHATDVVPSPVGELSVRWNEHHERWFMMYKNEINHTIVLRTAETLTGPWDDERVVLTSEEYPTMYAPLMLPIDGPEVYFTMSIFLPEYQVYVMRLTLEE